MTDVQWFAFVYLPIGVVVFAGVFTVVTMRLIEWGEQRRQHRAAE